MELLRIVAMLFVLILHATFETTRYPSSLLVRAEPFSWLGIIFTNQLTICCVDVFVLLTGWFGAHFKLQNMFKLIFQVAFISLSITAGLTLLRGELPGSPAQVLQSLYGYWFVCSYLLLYLLTPALNALADRGDEAELRRFLQVFFAFAIPASFLFTDLNRGFSTVSFIGLYLLGRYLRLYLAPRLGHVKARRFLCLFMGNVLFFSLAYWLYFWLKPVSFPNATMLMTAYTNPFTILNAALLLLFFSKLHFTSRWVNLLAAGSLAAYLTHQQPFVRSAYFGLIRHLDQLFATPLFILSAGGSILLIFILSVGLDSIRQWVWKKIAKLFARF